MNEPNVNDLAKVSKLFEALDEAGRKRLLALARRTPVADGAVICKEGEAGTEFWVLIKGRVRVTIDDLGAAKELAILEQGAFFGEMAVLNGQKRQATVTALGEGELVTFPRSAVDDILGAYPAVREVLNKVGLLRTEDTFSKTMG